MERIRLITTIKEGKLSLVVPDEFNNQEVEVIVSKQIQDAESGADNELTELHRRRMEHFGKAPLPHFPMTKYDVYNQ